MTQCAIAGAFGSGEPAHSFNLRAMRPFRLRVFSGIQSAFRVILFFPLWVQILLRASPKPLRKLKPSQERGILNSFFFITPEETLIDRGKSGEERGRGREEEVITSPSIVNARN